MIALDLFCGGGGAARGILAAGFDEIVGIDIKDHRKSYPGHFIRGDALHPPVRLEDFDFVWASPPCQKFSVAQSINDDKKDGHSNLIPETRELLSGHRFSVIENVPQAPVRADIVLTGMSVGLMRLLRRRHFETSFFAFSPQYMGKPTRDRLVTVTKRGGTDRASREYRRSVGLAQCYSKAEMAEAMGLPTTMTSAQIGEAVPPAYAEFIAREALRQIRA